MIHLYVAKQAGYVGFVSGQMDHGSFLNKSIGLQVEFTSIFQTNFFFSNYKSKSITTYLETMNKIN